MNIPEKISKIVTAVGVLLALFLLVVSIKELKSIAYVGKGVMSTKTISVEGTGKAMATPDVATFSFTVTESATSVADAQKLATDKINNALKAVRDQEIGDKDIKTLSYNIYPEYEYRKASCRYDTTGTNSAIEAVSSAREVLALPPSKYCPPGESVLIGYKVSQAIQIKVRDLSKAGTILTSIGTLSVQNIGGLNFEVDELETVKAEARQKAIENAEKKAKALARQLGVSLGKITSFYESSGPVPYYAYGLGGAAKAVEADVARVPEVPAGEQEVVSNISITYEID